MKKLLVLCLVLILSVSLVACQTQPSAPAPATDPASGTEPGSEAEGGGDLGTIAFFVKTPNNPFFVTMMEGAQARANELGVQIILDGPQAETDVAAQVAMVENAIAQGVGAIVIAPTDKTPLIPVLVRAHEAGIPVINVDDFIDKDELEAAGGHVVSFIGSDNFAGGQLAGRAMGEHFADQENVQIAIIEGMAGVPNSILRVTGFEDALSAFPNAEIVFSQPGDWDTQRGYDQATNALTAHPNLNGIFTANDQMALGAFAAAQALGRDDVVIIGYDANDDAVQMVLAGELFGTVAQYPADMGRQGVEAAVAAMRGESVAENIATLILFINQANAAAQLAGELG